MALRLAIAAQPLVYGCARDKVITPNLTTSPQSSDPPYLGIVEFAEGCSQFPKHVATVQHFFKELMVLP